VTVSRRSDRRYVVAAALLLLLGLLVLGRAVVSLLGGSEVAFADGQASAVADVGERWWVAAPAASRSGGVSCAATISGEGVTLQRVAAGQTVAAAGAEYRPLAELIAERAGDLVVRCTTGEQIGLVLVRDPASSTGDAAVVVPALLGLALLGAAAGGTWWLVVRRSGRSGRSASAEDVDGIDADALGEPEEAPEP
jgi:hypothetical protein